jgi:light-harvesting protein B-800-850 alpha chain
MNNARIWLVVKPGVGVPLLLSAVAIASLAVHIGVLTHTTWYPAFLQGNQHTHTALLNTTAPIATADAR